MVRVALGLSVTEPITPASVLRVVEARVCDDMWAWGFVAVRVAEVRAVLAGTAFGLPWHLSVSLFFGEVRNGGSLSWVDLENNWSHVGHGRLGTTACCGQPMEQGRFVRSR